MTALLSVENVSKSFPGVNALQEVSFKVEAGTVHAVMGENGAGKSTLMLCIAGVQRPDAGGRLMFKGQPLDLSNTREANARGIAIVFQELNLAPNLSIAENIALGQEPRTTGLFIDRRRMREQARQVMARLAITLDPDIRVGDLTIAQQQLVEICKSLVHHPSLLILDEPTSSLSEAEATVLFRVIGDLRREGVTMLYISHRMREVFALCDAVTVLRDGRHVKTMRLADINQDEIVRLMVGRNLAAVERIAPSDEARPVALSVRGLSDPPRYHDISFDLHQGEIVGMAGLIGAGRSEVALGIFGSPPPRYGEIRLGGEVVTIDRPLTAMRNGIGLVPEDRKGQGLVLMHGVGANLSLASLRRLARGGMIDFAAERKVVADYTQRLRIKTPGPEQIIGLLSGGNQQKVVLAKWLATRPKVLIIDEPTRGVDVGAKAEIYALMRELAAAGLAILVISSDLPEILTLSDRVLVMREGQIRGGLSHAEASEERIMSLAALEQSAA